LRSFKDLLVVMSLIAKQYLSATFTMSKVEFQHVFTSCGMRRMGSLWVAQVMHHAGRAMVVEWMMAKESFQM
jgi:hypothetical protein